MPDLNFPPLLDLMAGRGGARQLDGLCPCMPSHRLRPSGSWEGLHSPARILVRVQGRATLNSSSKAQGRSRGRPQERKSFIREYQVPLTAFPPPPPQALLFELGAVYFPLAPGPVNYISCSCPQVLDGFWVFLSGGSCAADPVSRAEPPGVWAQVRATSQLINKSL